MPIVTPWQDGERKTAAVLAEYHRLPPTWNAEVEYRIFARLFDLFSNRRHHAAELPPIKPTVAEILENPTNLTFHIALYDPDFSTFSYKEIIHCHEEVPELEALMRWAMVLYNQYPWHRFALCTDRVDLQDRTDQYVCRSSQQYLSDAEHFFPSKRTTFVWYPKSLSRHDTLSSHSRVRQT
jgi:hypothetical protein